MRRVLAAFLALFLCSATPRTAHASHELGEAIGLVFLFALDVTASVGSTVTGIGSSVQLSRDPPTLGWSIASIVVGTLAGIAGAITTAVLIASDVDDDAPGFWIFAGVPLALSAANLGIGIVNISRWGSAKPKAAPREERYDEVYEEDEWSRGPSPGVGVSIAW